MLTIIAFLEDFPHEIFQIVSMKGHEAWILELLDQRQEPEVYFVSKKGKCDEWIQAPPPHFDKSVSDSQ